MYFLRRALFLLVLAAPACSDKRMAMGDVNSVIVVAEDSLWAEVGDSVLAALQPRIFAVRDEPTFKLMHVTPTSSDWPQLRRFRQILAIGTPESPWVRQALAEADTTAEPPALVEADDVWARSQRVTAVLLPETGQADVVRSMLEPLAGLLDRRYRVWAQRRMYYSGHDEGLADTLRSQAGFTLDVPNVYRWRQTADSAYMFLNDEPDASKLVRSFLVTWRAGAEDQPTVESALDWRDSIAASQYDWGQRSLRDRVETRQLMGGRSEEGEALGEMALEIRGAWSGTASDFPQGGPFMTWIVDCPSQDRRYLLDGWLYAPARDKYQYMIQLETLLRSFRCGVGGDATAGSAGDAG